MEGEAEDFPYSMCSGLQTAVVAAEPGSHCPTVADTYRHSPGLPCEPAGWQTYCHPHLTLSLKTCISLRCGFSGRHCTCTLAMHLFLSPTLIFSVDILLYLGNSSVVPDFPQLEMISRNSPTTVTFWSDPGRMSSPFMSERGSFPHLGAETNILLLILFNHI